MQRSFVVLGPSRVLPYDRIRIRNVTIQTAHKWRRPSHCERKEDGKKHRNTLHSWIFTLGLGSGLDTYQPGNTLTGILPSLDDKVKLKTTKVSNVCVQKYCIAPWV